MSGGDDEDELLDELIRQADAEIARNERILERVGDFDPRSIRARRAEYLFR